MSEKVLETIRRITGFDATDQNDLQIQVPWDSFTQVELVLALEAEFNLRFSADEIEKFRTIEKIVQSIEGKLGKAN